MERVHIAKFSNTFLTSEEADFYVKDANTNVDTNNFSNKKFGKWLDVVWLSINWLRCQFLQSIFSSGFVAGWATSEKCIARQFKDKNGIPLKEPSIFYASTPTELEELINNGTVSIISIVHSIACTVAYIGFESTLYSNNTCNRIIQTVFCIYLYR